MILAEKFGSNLIVGEIGIYWKQSGENFLISVDQVLSRSHLQRLNY